MGNALLNGACLPIDGAAQLRRRITRITAIGRSALAAPVPLGWTGVTERLVIGAENPRTVLGSVLRLSHDSRGAHTHTSCGTQAPPGTQPGGFAAAVRAELSRAASAPYKARGHRGRCSACSQVACTGTSHRVVA